MFTICINGVCLLCEYVSISSDDNDPTPCSCNLQTLWVDVVVLIDNSAASGLYGVQDVIITQFISKNEYITTTDVGKRFDELIEIFVNLFMCLKGSRHTQLIISSAPYTITNSRM